MEIDERLMKKSYINDISESYSNKNFHEAFAFTDGDSIKDTLERLFQMPVKPARSNNAYSGKGYLLPPHAFVLNAKIIPRGTIQLQFTSANYSYDDNCYIASALLPLKYLDIRFGYIKFDIFTKDSYRSQKSETYRESFRNVRELARFLIDHNKDIPSRRFHY